MTFLATLGLFVTAVIGIFVECAATSLAAFPCFVATNILSAEEVSAKVTPAFATALVRSNFASVGFVSPSHSESARLVTRNIVNRESTGCAPEAVSADNITAVAP